MLSPDLARRFSESWFAAWNSRDLGAIMACYAPQIEHSSPLVARYASDPAAATLKGKEVDEAGKVVRSISHDLEATP